ncbi:hypothetical protein [Pontivivens ytuae]|uniref:Uncharacterized protein n=1 Tax=Pontivivens ytuae TaxID=2789856 RepID=A0A7S9QEU6_9RHOB|nr:hypothetical protein [Pontivivens ytuae]QPH55581.1 hypothetical protein I0K15_07565 [Pontivivens ytuae]
MNHTDLTLQIDRPNRYRMSGQFVGRVHDAGLGLHGMRLALALAHRTCRETDDWDCMFAPRPQHASRALCSELAVSLGLAASKSSRAIDAGYRALIDSCLFDIIGFDERSGRWLVWKWREDVYSDLFWPSPYGTFDISWFHGLRTEADLKMHMRIGIVRACRTPRLTHHFSLLAGEAGRPWHREARRLLPSLERIARAMRIRIAAVAYDDWCGETGADTVELRIAHADTRWCPRRAGAVPTATTSVTLVAPDLGAQHVRRADASRALTQFLHG